jgi:hypothetical protein
MNTQDRPYDCDQVLPRVLTRRDLLKSVSAGFGWLAFAGLSAQAAAPYQSPLLPRAPHFTPRARRVIFLAMQGGPSHLDTFDYKPRLIADAGKPGDKGRLVAPVAPFQQRGQSGLWISDAFPKLAEHADELCLLNGMHTDIPNHPQAFVQLHTGSARFVRPSMGAWTLYGLGTENQNLPGFITIAAPIAQGGAQNYGSAFLPASYQGTRLDVPSGGGGPGAARKKGNSAMAAQSEGIGNIRNTRLSAEAQREQLDLVQSMNRDLLEASGGNSDVEGVIQSYELAFRMQTEVPKVMDFRSESPATLKAYGIGSGATDGFGRQCLMARRFAEAGVRFIEICHQGWDHHNGLRSRLTASCAAVDQPIAALLTDLKERGLLKDTLVIWGGEFGRTPGNGAADGRGHNARGFTMWMAGGGVKGGMAYGATDQYGSVAVENKMHIHDLHATALHLLGLDHEKLTYRYAGRDFRLTDVYGNVVKDIIA